VTVNHRLWPSGTSADVSSPLPLQTRPSISWLGFIAHGSSSGKTRWSASIARTRDLKHKLSGARPWKHALLHELPGDRAETGQHHDMLTDRENELPLAGDSALIMRIVVDLQSILGSYCDFRRPFVTMLGQMGSTGTNCDVHFEDKVCVFVGSAVPYLLRPVDQARSLYRFVGCCWLHWTCGSGYGRGTKEGVWGASGYHPYLIGREASFSDSGWTSVP
jgi:hypothetical protein